MFYFLGVLPARLVCRFLYFYVFAWQGSAQHTVSLYFHFFIIFQLSFWLISTEEWKRRYEKEKEKNAKLRAMLQQLEKEVARWRSGESVPVHERMTSQKEQKAPEVIEVPQPVPLSQSPKSTVTVINNELSEEERMKFDEERSKLYKQLDERVSDLFCYFCPYMWRYMMKACRPLISRWSLNDIWKAKLFLTPSAGFTCHWYNMKSNYLLKGLGWMCEWMS